MLTKLLHYEFRSTGRGGLPVAAGVLVLNLLTSVLAHFIQNTANRLPLVGFGMVLLTFASFISLLVVFVLCFFVEVRQFYRLLGDRGYLMLALPVQPWKHIAAKVICGTVWTLFGELFVSLCAASSILSYDAVDFSPFRPEDFWPYALMFLILVVCVAYVSGLRLCGAVYPAAAAHQHLRLLRYQLYRAGDSACVCGHFRKQCGFRLNVCAPWRQRQCGCCGPAGGSYRLHSGGCPFVGADPVVYDQTAESGITQKSRSRTLQCAVFGSGTFYFIKSLPNY